MSMCMESHAATGVVNTGADITIIEGDLFKKVAATTRPKKRISRELTPHHAPTCINDSSWTD